MTRFTFFVYLLVFVSHGLAGQTVTGKSEPVRISVDKEAPRNQLAYLSVAFTDSTKNQTLSAGEKGVIQFTIRNVGKTTSQRLLVRASALSDTAIIRFPEEMVIEPIVAGQQQPVTIPVEGMPDFEAGTATVTIEIKEEFEFDPDQIEINIILE